jgi:nucleotide-binding universal stress UspA family protein
MAAKIAAGVGAKIYLLHVSYFDRTTDDVRESWLPESITAPAGEQEEAIMEQARALIPAGVVAECHHRTGAPAEQIIAFARQHQPELIVIGGRKISNVVEGFLLGSVSRDVLRDSPMSVLVIK